MIALLIALLFAAPAPAATRTVAQLSDGASFALAGDTILYTDIVGRSVRVYAVPVAGGAPREVFRHRAGLGATTGLFASPQRAVLNTIDEFSGYAFAWSLAGGWEELETSAFPSEQFTYRVDGAHLIDLGSEKLKIDGAATIALPELEAEVAGDLVAYARGRRLIVRNWRSGATVRTLTYSTIQAYALRPDGRVAVLTYDLEVFDAPPGAAPRLVADGVDGQLGFAGERLVYRRGNRLRVDGYAFGPPTTALGNVVADDTHVLWEANRCLLVADIGDGASAQGGCPELELVNPESPRPLARTIRLRLRCIVGPCGGTLRLYAGEQRVVSGRQRFVIAAGKARTITVRLTASGYRSLRRGGVVALEADGLAPDTPALRVLA